MDRLLGYLAQFGSFSRQGELLCTQGLCYLLKRAEGDRAFVALISSATGNSVKPGLSWHAESRQADGGRPDLEGRNAEGHAEVKIEAKLGASFGEGQLESYISAFCASGRGGTLLIVVPRSRLDEITSHAKTHCGIESDGPWRIKREPIEIPCAVISWEHLFEKLDAVPSDGFRDDLGQLHAMYRVFNGDDMEPLTSHEHVLAWRERETWWEIFVEHATRELTATSARILPFGVETGAQPYRRRYVCRPVPQEDSCYSVGTRDPFQNHRTPIWLRFHSGTGRFAEIVSSLERSALWTKAVLSQGHLWFPLEVPLNSSREAMIAELVAQVRRILAVAYAVQSL
jgi:hypothetical protein